MPETNISLADEECLGISRNLESKRGGATPAERRLAGKYKESRARVKLLLPLSIIWAALGGVGAAYIFHEEPGSTPNLISCVAMAFHGLVSCFGLCNLYKDCRILMEADRVFGVEPDINLDDKKAPSAPTTSRALDEIRNLGQVNHSFLESSVHVEGEAAPLLNDHFSIELTEIKMTRPASKATVSLV